MWIVPGLMVLAVVAGTYYSGLSDKGTGFALTLAVSMLLVGFGEEGMFRGLGVTTFRVNGYSEWRVALWTCVIFGLAHGTNLFLEGPKAFLQVAVTAIAGVFLYLTRRVSGGLVVPALVHALWDFGLFSGNIKEDYLYPGAAAFMGVNVVIVIILFLRRKRIDPEPVTAPATA